MTGMAENKAHRSDGAKKSCIIACARIVFCICAGLAAAPATGDVTISLPLQGFYRPGQYMPVRASVTPDPASADHLQIEGDATMATRLALVGGRAGAVVPV